MKIIFQTKIVLLAAVMMLLPPLISWSEDGQTGKNKEISLGGIEETITLKFESPNKNFFFLVGLNSYLSAIETRYIKSRRPPRLRDMRLYIQSLPVIENQVYCDYTKTGNDKYSYFPFISFVADLMEKGQCIIIDKKTNEEITKLLFQRWADFTSGGRLFKTLDGLEVLKTFEWIA